MVTGGANVSKQCRADGETIAFTWDTSRTILYIYFMVPTAS